MKIIGFLLMLASLASGVWAVNKTVALMHEAANVFQPASQR